MPKSPKLTPRLDRAILYLLVGLLAGALLFAGYRFFSYQDDSVHYHANFGIYVNGHREALDNPLLYQEVISCSDDESNDPQHRAHMHEQVSDVVHVHARAVTWGQFLENLGYSVSDEHLKTSTAIFLNNDDSNVSFVLNDKRVTDISNRVIQSEDKLLISYGRAGQTSSIQNPLAQQFDAIAGTAAEHNHHPDPASCSGANGSSWQERFKHILF